MWSFWAPLRRQDTGFSYLTVMIALTFMGIAMTVAARQWKTMVQRELEADLLAKGIEIQTALALYSTNAKAGRVLPGEVYPQALAELTRLPRPFLRKVYLDPVERGEWELLRSPAGGIMGVRSKSRQKPIKQGNFPLAVRHFEGKSTYFDWLFQYPNPSIVSALGPISTPSPAPAQPALVNKGMPPDPPTVIEPLMPPDDAMDSADSPSSMNQVSQPESPSEPVIPSETIQ
jgi:type II secretory pathway pseudopilin PulG